MSNVNEVNAVSATDTAWPTEIKLNKTKDELSVAFDDGNTFTLSAEMLRVMSPSAEVQGHSPDERKTIPGKKHVKITNMEPIGNYALRIDFDDGHNTGLFSWGLLHQLGSEKDARWGQYLSELADKGLTRE